MRTVQSTMSPPLPLPLPPANNFNLFDFNLDGIGSYPNVTDGQVIHHFPRNRRLIAKGSATSLNYNDS